jgi:transcription antitermination factor NusG
VKRLSQKKIIERFKIFFQNFLPEIIDFFFVEDPLSVFSEFLFVKISFSSRNLLLWEKEEPKIFFIYRTLNRKEIAVVQDEEIERFKEELKKPKKLEFFIPKIGERVRISKGPLEGFEGVVDLVKSKNAVVLLEKVPLKIEVPISSLVLI